MAQALPFGVAGPDEEVVDPAAGVAQVAPIAGSLAMGVLNIPKKLIDASAEAVPGLRKEDVTDNPKAKEPNQPMYDAAWDTARALAGPAPATAETNAAGIFGGKLAKTADLKALHEAEQMRMNGTHPDDVWKNTGWFRSPADEQWRFEIPDNKSALSFMPSTQGDMASGSAGALMNHKELYKAYPQTGFFPTNVTRDAGFPLGTGSHHSGTNVTNVIAPDMQIGRSVMLHELQHGVQNAEGFSPGANPQWYSEMIQHQLKSRPEMGAYDLNTINEQARSLYKKTAGEVEARNVQVRSDLSPQQRMQQPPWYTQDVPYKDQYHFDPVAETLRALRQR